MAGIISEKYKDVQEIEKTLGISGKEQIEEYGVEKFVKR